jgi:hypothetical protein
LVLELSLTEFHENRAREQWHYLAGIVCYRIDADPVSSAVLRVGFLGPIVKQRRRDRERLIAPCVPVIIARNIERRIRAVQDVFRDYYLCDVLVRSPVLLSF